jgi:endoglucanase
MRWRTALAAALGLAVLVGPFSANRGTGEDRDAPSAVARPSAVYASVSGDDVVLTWQLSAPETGVDHYEVLRSATYSPSIAGYAAVSPNLAPGTSSWTDAGIAATEGMAFYAVRAVEAGGYTSVAQSQAGLHVTPRAAGAHLVSTPWINSGTRPVDVVTGTASWTVARTFDASDAADPWGRWDVGRSGNDATHADRARAFWVNVESGGQLRLAGSVPCSTLIGLRAGWNLVGFPSAGPRSLGTVTAGLAGPLAVEGPDPTAADYRLRRLGPTDLLTPGEGYWFQSPVAQTLLVVNDPSALCEDLGTGPGTLAIDFPLSSALLRDEVDYANQYGQWLTVESERFVGLHFKDAYDDAKVPVAANYAIQSADDPAYAVAQQPVTVSFRYRVLYAPLQEDNLIVAHRVFLELPSPLLNGRTYTVAAGDIGIPTLPMRFTFDDRVQLNENVKVNQVGYLPSGPKVAFLGEYRGTLGGMPFSATTFEVREASTEALAATGTVQLTTLDDSETGESVYELDFSSLASPGTYYLRVPGVGRSHAFRVAGDVYDQVSGIYQQGFYHARSADALAAPYTRYARGAAHAADATVLGTDPPPPWMASLPYYPNPLGGQWVDTSRGHFDAGDWGKYTENGALVVGFLLHGFEAFPGRLDRDDLGLPYSGNGIPDALDEAKWELDWLERMQDPSDGGVWSMVRPDQWGYGSGMPDEPANQARFIYPKDTTYTAAFAAALALAARSPAVQAHYPADAVRYLAKAELAWQFLEANPGQLDFFHYGRSHGSADERAWAAMELYAATGTSPYRDYVMANHWPEGNQWGWVKTHMGWGQADHACAFLQRPDFDPAMKARCVAAIVDAGDFHVAGSAARSYRLSMADNPIDYGQYGWFFPQLQIYQLLMANAVAPDPDYERTALQNMDFVLGANPSGYSLVTGIGARRLRGPVDQTSRYDRIDPPTPGIIQGLASGRTYLSEYGAAMTAEYPTPPLLARTYDGWNLNVERTIDFLAAGLVGALYFSSPAAANTPPEVLGITASVTRGAAPLAVTFTPATQDDGSVVSWFWDFGDGGYSTERAPTHVYRDPLRQSQPVLTVTDNRGAMRYADAPSIETQVDPARFADAPYAPDAATLALFHLDGDFTDAAGHAYAAAASPTGFSLGNRAWMTAPTGATLRFGGFADTATITIPRADLWNGPGDTLDLEAKVYIEDYDGYSSANVHLFGLYQGWNRYFTLYEGKWSPPEVAVYNPGGRSVVLGDAALDAAIPRDEWFELHLVLSGGGASVYVDGALVASATVQPQFETSSADLTLRLGGFYGYLDEIRISNVVRGF